MDKLSPDPFFRNGAKVCIQSVSSLDLPTGAPVEFFSFRRHLIRKFWGKIYRGVHVHSLTDCQQTFARREPHQNLVFFPVPIYLFPTTTNIMDGPITHSDQYIPQPGKFSFEME